LRGQSPRTERQEVGDRNRKDAGKHLRQCPGRLMRAPHAVAAVSSRVFLLIAVVGVLTAGTGAATAADLQAGRRKAEPCAACHGADGNASIAGTPSLAGQPIYFTHWQLIKFRDGRRKDQQMSPVAKDLSDADMADLAAFYQAQVPRGRTATLEPARIAAGAKLADFHHCSSCHRPGFTGQQQAARLAGQDYDYLLKLLRGFKAKTASDLDGTMTIAAQPLSDEDIVNLVQYISSLGATP